MSTSTPGDAGTAEAGWTEPPSSRRAVVRFADVLVLSKRETFELCEACAEAERALLRAGRVAEAARMAALFELVEGRLVLSS